MDTATAFNILVQFLPLVFISILAHWRFNPVMFLLAGIIAIFNGLYWYDVYDTPTGLAISLCLIVYGLVCIGLAYGNLFRRTNGNDED